MTATQDLIAAALMLADEFDSDLERPTPQAAEVREMCARAMAQPVSEVPMPEPDIEICYEESVLCHSDECIRQYGDAREAAGYAAGVAEGGEGAERYRYLRDESDWPAVFARHDAPEPLIGVDLDAAIDAALRGEVEP